MGEQAKSLVAEKKEDGTYAQFYTQSTLEHAYGLCGSNTSISRRLSRLVLNVILLYLLASQGCFSFNKIRNFCIYLTKESLPTNWRPKLKSKAEPKHQVKLTAEEYIQRQNNLKDHHSNPSTLRSKKYPSTTKHLERRLCRSKKSKSVCKRTKENNEQSIKHNAQYDLLHNLQRARTLE
ncbi:hypothetical protein BDB00DRAFT_792788 [Zychaea mexicana]|uniref:uncharacterized protein n=1 Tax=Zychaea mexicana TaxID=64656 RepID=UPI0022FF1EE3|nr:uncharacterized protein BDB00DRAFT_792788 [Zychaea mexicana]KAI9484505.1 hypothetical protein BDB00DRAFT_792788 [Zychaea mexicana]